MPPETPASEYEQQGYDKEDAALLERSSAQMEPPTRLLAENMVARKIHVPTIEEDDAANIRADLDKKTKQYFELRNFLDDRRWWKKEAAPDIREAYDKEQQLLRKQYGDVVVPLLPVELGNRLTDLSYDFEVTFLPDDAAIGRVSQYPEVLHGNWVLWRNTGVRPLPPDAESYLHGTLRLTVKQARLTPFRSGFTVDRLRRYVRHAT